MGSLKNLYVFRQKKKPRKWALVADYDLYNAENRLEGFYNSWEYKRFLSIYHIDEFESLLYMFPVYFRTKPELFKELDRIYNWVWDFGTWAVYVNNHQGAAVQVNADSTPAQAASYLREYWKLMGYV